MASRNADQTRRELNQLHRDAHDDGAEASGYTTDGGETKSIPGDEEAPFVKTLPFAEAAQQWASAIPLRTAAYTTLEQVDVTDYRTITIYIELVVPAAGEAEPLGESQPSIIAEHLAVDNLGDEAWYVQGVLDSALSVVTPPSPFDYPFGSREFYPAEFRAPAAFEGPRTIRFKLVFEVSDAVAFRISVAELTGGADEQNLMSVKYARAV